MNYIGIFLITLSMIRLSHCAVQAPTIAAQQEEEKKEAAASSVLSAEGTTDIFDAIIERNLNAVKYWLEQNIDVNARDEDGWTALEYAIYRGHTNIAQLLLDRGADVTLKTKLKTTIIGLLENAHKGPPPQFTDAVYRDLFRLLIEHGAEIDNQSIQQFLGSAAKGDVSRAAQIQFLIDNNLKYVETVFMDVVAQHKYDDVEFLITRGMNPYIKNSSGFDAFDYAENDQKMLNILKQTKYEKPEAEPIAGDITEAMMRQEDDDIKRMIRRLEHIDRAMNPVKQEEQKEAAAVPAPNLLANGGEITTL